MAYLLELWMFRMNNYTLIDGCLPLQDNHSMVYQNCFNIISLWRLTVVRNMQPHQVWAIAWRRIKRKGGTMSFFWSCYRGDNGRSRRSMSDQERIKPGTNLASFVEHLSLKSGNMHSTGINITTFELHCFLWFLNISLS